MVDCSGAQVTLSGIELWQTMQRLEVSVSNSTGDMMSRLCTASVAQTLTCALDPVVTQPAPAPVEDCSTAAFDATLRVLVQVGLGTRRRSYPAAIPPPPHAPALSSNRRPPTRGDTEAVARWQRFRVSSLGVRANDGAKGYR